jgi:hypothetical protein
MDMHIRAHRCEDALMLARPEADKRYVLIVQLEWNLNFPMGLHAGHGVARGIDDMEVDQVRPSRHEKWKGVDQPCLGADFADEPFQVWVGPHVIRKCLTLPS